MNAETKAAIAEIMLAALEVNESGAAHVFVRFSGHVNVLSVDANPVTQDYSKGVEHVRLMWHEVHVSGDMVNNNLMDRLHAIRDEINALRKPLAKTA